MPSYLVAAAQAEGWILSPDEERGPTEADMPTSQPPANEAQLGNIAPVGKRDFTLRCTQPSPRRPVAYPMGRCSPVTSRPSSRMGAHSLLQDTTSRPSSVAGRLTSSGNPHHDAPYHHSLAAPDAVPGPTVSRRLLVPAESSSAARPSCVDEAFPRGGVEFS